MKHIVETTTSGTVESKKESIINQLTGSSTIPSHCQNVDVVDFNTLEEYGEQMVDKMYDTLVNIEMDTA